MPIPNSGPISLSTLQAEFGGANPISLSEYYAGGGLVPPGTSGINGAVPSSGPIDLAKFYGTSAAVYYTGGYTVTGGNGIDSGYAQINIGSDGNAILSSDVSSDAVNWVTPTSIASSVSHWVRGRTFTGAALSSTPGTGWVNVNTSPGWRLEFFGTGSATTSFIIEVAKDPSGTNIVSVNSVFLQVIV